jgi:hypothetical protein
VVDGSQIVQIIGRVTPVMAAPATPPSATQTLPEIAISGAGAAVAVGAAGYVAAKSLPLLLPAVYERHGIVLVFDVPAGGDARPRPAGDGTYRLSLRWWGVPVLSLAGPGLEAVSADGGRTWQPTPAARWEPGQPVSGRQVRLRMAGGGGTIRVNDGWRQEQVVQLSPAARAVRARVVMWPRDVPSLWLHLGGRPLRPWRGPVEVSASVGDDRGLRVVLDHLAVGYGRWRGGRLMVVLHPVSGGGDTREEPTT